MKNKFFRKKIFFKIYVRKTCQKFDIFEEKKQDIHVILVDFEEIFHDFG